MTLAGAFRLAVSTIAFLLAATCAKSWALEPSYTKLLLTIGLYSVGNLIMLRLVREFGMASAFSLSAIIQLVAINMIALMFFGERLSIVQSAGVVFSIVALCMITFGSTVK